MVELLRWLEGVERMACDLYGGGAACFTDKGFSEFLARLARDESWHAHLMASAADYVRSNPSVGIEWAVTLTEEARANVEAPLRCGREMLARGEVSERRMIELMVDAEFSEFNTLFLYVMSTLKAHSRQFQYGAAAVQAHERRINEFLERLPDELRPARDIQDLPAVWQTRFLVVDDEPPLRDLFSRLLRRLGDVETAENGADALAKTGETFYNVIITDVTMPVMDGLEFYRRAVRDDPAAGAQFIFYTGALTAEAAAFFQANRLPYLIKPFTLDAVTEMVGRILRAFPEPAR